MSRAQRLYDSLNRGDVTIAPDVSSTVQPGPAAQPTPATEPPPATVDNAEPEGIVAIDYETDEFDAEAGIGPHNAAMIGMSFKERGQPAQYITQGVADKLQSFGARRRVYHNALFDRAVEHREGLPLADHFDCTLMMARLLDETQSNKLKSLGKHLLGRDVVTYAEVDRADPIAFAAYAAQDAELTLALLDEARLLDRIRDEGLEYTYHEIELPVVDPTIAMIQNGILLDIPLLEQYRDDGTRKALECKAAIERVAGKTINLNSAPQKSALLYQQLGLPVLDRTPKGNRPKTDVKTLKRLAGQHPVVDLLLEHSEAQTLVRFATQLLRLVNRSTGRAHCSLNPLRADTGRYSCSQPNLQNIPSGMLDVFIAPPGHVLLEADFSQIELRVLAHFSQDPSLVHAYCHGNVDLHRRTAAMALGITEDRVTPKQRDKIGKAINFGIIYGQTEYGLSRGLDVSVDEARRFINGYLRGYPRVAEWIEQTKQQARLHGHVRTLYGRRRHLPQVWSPDRAVAARGLRQAVNSVIQGTAADINKMAITRVHRALPPDARLLLTVHDSVLIEVPEPMVDEVRALVVEVMETPPPNFTIPLTVDVHPGRTWAACKEKG